MRSVNYDPFLVVKLYVVMLNVVAPTGGAPVSFINIRVACNPLKATTTLAYMPVCFKSVAALWFTLDLLVRQRWDGHDGKLLDESFVEPVEMLVTS